MNLSVIVHGNDFLRITVVVGSAHSSEVSPLSWVGGDPIDGIECFLGEVACLLRGEIAYLLGDE